jgi:hypothetical protein
LYSGFRSSIISWNYTGNGTTVNIELYDKGKLNSVLATGVPIGSSYNWFVSNNIKDGNDYKIKITTNLGITGISDKVFTITHGSVSCCFNKIVYPLYFDYNYINRTIFTVGSINNIYWRLVPASTGRIVK